MGVGLLRGWAVAPRARQPRLSTLHNASLSEVLTPRSSARGAACAVGASGAGKASESRRYARRVLWPILRKLGCPARLLRCQGVSWRLCRQKRSQDAPCW